MFTHSNTPLVCHRTGEVQEVRLVWHPRMRVVIYPPSFVRVGYGHLGHLYLLSRPHLPWQKEWLISQFGDPLHE